MKIAVWDDNPNAAIEWKGRLEAVLPHGSADIHAATAQEIEDDLRVLHERRKTYLECGVDREGQSRLDDTHILIVDHDLFDLPKLNDLSAETVANRVSIYTDCAYIVVLNRNPDLDFDLTLLGNPESKADLHINDRFVGNIGLWRECPATNGAFRPWHWPLLPWAVDLYESRLQEVVALLNSDDSERPILDHLGFGDSCKRRLSRAARAFLHPKIPADQVTFSSFLQGNAKAVSLRDGAKIASRRDVRKIARIGARRVSKWLARYVVGPQDPLIDLPHLVEKMPFLVPPQERESIDYWNSCAKLRGAPTEVVSDAKIGKFQGEKWFDRPCFWAAGMETEENVNRLIEESDANVGSLVFCEDASAFHNAELCDQFVAAHNSMSDNRFVRWLSESEGVIRYGPQSRLAQ